MKKTKKYAKVGALILGIGNAALNVNKQLAAIKANPELKFNWSALLSALTKGAVLGTVAGGSVGAIVDYRNSLIRPIKTDTRLFEFTERIRLDKRSEKFTIINDKAGLLSQLLEGRFKHKLSCSPERLGSTEKGTALQQKFDIDIALKFRHNSFASTAKMRFAVLRFLEKQKNRFGIIEIREQRTSVGVVFDKHGIEFKIDVVPIKITEGNRHSGYLSVLRPSMLADEYSHQKTNIKVLKSFKLSKTQKRIVLLLKHWKEKYDVPIGSHLLENLVIDAYTYSRHIPVGLTKQAIMVLRHIATNLDVAVIRGVENSNNVITNIDSDKKQRIIKACRRAVDDYEYQPNTVLKLI